VCLCIFWGGMGLLRLRLVLRKDRCGSWRLNSGSEVDAYVCMHVYMYVYSGELHKSVAVSSCVAEGSMRFLAAEFRI
jgi:hypothetical protein